MLAKLSNKQKILAFVIVGILVIGCVFLIASVVKFAVNQFTPEPTHEPPLQITYCGAYPEGVCVLYFGEDGKGDTLVQLFVSPPTFPNFYLTINKTTGQVIYECQKDGDEETNITCRGEALLLGEQVEIKILSTEGDIPIAAGKFAVTAIFVINQNDNFDVPPISTSTPNPSYP